jgi:hypothetical protein
MATTTPYGIYYPIASDSVAPLHTAFSTLADSVNTALNTYVAPLTATQQNGAYTVASVGAMNAITGMAAGATCFVTGTKASYQYSGTSWVLMYQPWTDYTPSAITGFGFSAAKYTVSNNMVTVYAKISRIAGTPTATTLTLSLPLTSVSPVVDSKMPIGSGIFNDVASTTSFGLMVWQDSTTSARILYANGNPLKLNNINLTGTTPAPFNTNGDYFVVNFTYPLP